MLTETFDFTAPDGRTVAARLDRPAGQVSAYALFAHCFACGKDALASARISRALAAEGIATLRIDFAGPRSARSKAPRRSRRRARRSIPPPWRRPARIEGAGPFMIRSSRRRPRPG